MEVIIIPRNIHLKIMVITFAKQVLLIRSLKMFFERQNTPKQEFENQELFSRQVSLFLSFCEHHW